MVRWLVAGATIVVLGGAPSQILWADDEEGSGGTEALEYRGRAYRNPFHGLLQPQPDAAAATAVPVAPPAMAITGIVWGSQKPMAIINGRLVGIGDVVGDAEIVAVERGAVRVRVQGQEFVLTVP